MIDVLIERSWTCTRWTGRSPSTTSRRHMPPTCKPRMDTDVRYLRYWVDQSHGKIFCLVDAPDADAAAAVRRAVHGLVADEIYPVTEGRDIPPRRIGC